MEDFMNDFSAGRQGRSVTGASYGIGFAIASALCRCRRDHRL